MTTVDRNKNDSAITAETRALLLEFSHRLLASTGLSFSAERHSDLVRYLQHAADDLGLGSVHAYLSRMTRQTWSAEMLAQVVSYVTVGETYFFRDDNSWKFIEHEILRPLIAQRAATATPYLRIWSAGCCTGEEIYSLAILLDQLLPDLGKWQLQLCATDINAQFIQIARAGIYGSWSFRRTTDAIRDKYFTRLADGRYMIRQALKVNVTFEYLNLVEHQYPDRSKGLHDFDLILCRNVLMYMAETAMTPIVNRLRDCLAEQSWLLVSACETSQLPFQGFESFQSDDGFYFRKCGTPTEKPKGKTERRETSCLHRLGQLSSRQFNAMEESSFTIGPISRFDDSMPVTETENRSMLTESSSDYLVQARQCANQGRLREAEEYCHQALQHNKCATIAHYLLALVQQEQGFASQAAASLKRALYLEPEFVMAHFMLGQLALRHANHDDSMRHFFNALHCLQTYADDDEVPESGIVNAARFREILLTLLRNGGVK